jgi:hypothetical protein
MASDALPDQAADRWWLSGYGTPGISGFGFESLHRCGDEVLLCGSFESVGSAPALGVARLTKEGWLALPGTPHQVFDAIICQDGSIVIGGPFEKVDEIAAAGLAKWHKGKWNPLGTAGNFSAESLIALRRGGFAVSGGHTNGNIISMGIWIKDDNSEKQIAKDISHGEPCIIRFAELPDGRLVAAGRFSRIDGVEAQNIATWNGSTWVPLGDGLPWYLTGLLVDNSGGLIACGHPGITIKGNSGSIARWDGKAWRVFSDSHGAPRIMAMCLDEKGALWVIGQPRDEKPGAKWRLGSWDGAAWRWIEASAASEIRALAPDPRGGFIVAGDQLDVGVCAKGIARWNDDKWQPACLGAGADDHVAGFIPLPDNQMLIVGDFSLCAGVRSPGAVIWTDKEATPLGNGLGWSTPHDDRDDEPMAVHDAISLKDGMLVVVGCFDRAGDVTARCVAAWHKGKWQPVGLGMVGNVRAVVSLPDDRLLAGGKFSLNDKPCCLAEFADGRWSPFGGMIDDDVTALAVGPTGELYVAGFFQTIGGIDANHVAMYREGKWSSLGKGVDESALALVVHPQGGFVLGGNFKNAGGKKVNHIARWNGAEWSAVGTGLDNTVCKLAVSQDGMIAAAGMFCSTSDNSVLVQGVGVFAGSSWHALGSGIAPGENLPWGHAVCFTQDGALLVGGRFGRVGDKAAGNWAKFDLKGFLSAKGIGGAKP